MKKTLISLILCLAFVYGHGQTNKPATDEPSPKMEEKYQALKDSLSQFPQLIPAVSSIIIGHKQIEINFFNSLITANKYRTKGGIAENSTFRQTYFYNGLQITYGLPKDNLNIGLDVNTTSAMIDYNRENSYFKIFLPYQEPNRSSGLTVTSIGPRVRWRPFTNNYRFIIQGNVLFPTYGNSSSKNLLGQEQTYISTQIFYSQPLYKKLFLFSQTGVQYGFKNNLGPSVLLIPITGYLCYLVFPKTVLFGLASHNQLLSRNIQYKVSNTTQAGLGLQYQFSNRYFFNVYYASEIAGKNYNIFDNYSLSIRVLLH